MTPRPGRAAAFVMTAMAAVLAGSVTAFESGGLSVTPMAGYFAEGVDEPGFTASIAIRSGASDVKSTGFLKDRICGLGFAMWDDTRPVLRESNQAQLNALTVGPALAQTRSSYAPGTVLSVKTTILGGEVAWSELILSPEEMPGVRVFLSNAMTPAGGYSMACSAFDDEFDAALPGFRTMRDSVRGPR